MPNSWVDISVDGQVMDAYLTKPNDDEKHPAVIVIQEVWGVNSHIQYVTDRLPAAGYVGLAPSMFHREGRMVMGMHEEMETAFARMGACTDANIVADVKAAVAWLQQQPYVDADRIGIVGFCFGGRVSFLSACNIPELKAASVFYGGRMLGALGDGPAPIEQVANINCPVLGTLWRGGPEPDSCRRRHCRSCFEAEREDLLIPHVPRLWSRLPLQRSRQLPPRIGPRCLGQDHGLVRRARKSVAMQLGRAYQRALP